MESIHFFFFPTVHNGIFVVVMVWDCFSIGTYVLSAQGFNVETVEYKNISFTVWDVGGQDKVCIFDFILERWLPSMATNIVLLLQLTNWVCKNLKRLFILFFCLSKDWKWLSDFWDDCLISLKKECYRWSSAAFGYFHNSNRI